MFVLFAISFGFVIAIVVPACITSLLLVLFHLSVSNRSTQLPISDVLDSLMANLNTYFPNTFFACVFETQTGNVRELNPSSVLCQS